MTGGGDIWVFGYGSLMWRPGFEYEEARPGLLRGYHRSFCMYSHRYRGTPDTPGLVLALDRGGACRGTAFRVAAARAVAVLEYLNEREMPTRAYQRRVLPVLAGTERVRAYAFVMDRSHKQYAGKLPTERVVELILQGEGAMGHCRDYLHSTVAHLDDLGIHDRGLRLLRKRVDQALAERAAADTAPKGRRA